MSFSLDSISNTKKKQPARVVIHAVEGIGKSTFGANLPAPIFIQSEDGLAGVDTSAFPVAACWQDIEGQLRTLCVEEHNFRTLCVDTLDSIERLIWAQVAVDAGVSTIEDMGYGKGYKEATLYWQRFLNACDYLRNEKGMMIFLICHTNVQLFKSPITEPYERYQVALHKDASALVRGWCDILGFANWHTVTKQDGEKFGQKQQRGIGTGLRELHLVERPAWQAKNRYDMPETIPFDARNPSHFLGLIYARDEDSTNPSAPAEDNTNQEKEN